MFTKIKPPLEFRIQIEKNLDRNHQDPKLDLHKLVLELNRGLTLNPILQNREDHSLFWIARETHPDLVVIMLKDLCHLLKNNLINLYRQHNQVVVWMKRQMNKDSPS